MQTIDSNTQLPPEINKDPSLSVVICTYNGEKYIGEQIESILQQTLLPEEIIVGDDGSTDKTLHIIEGLRAKIEGIGIRLTIYKNNHEGPHGNFRRTLQLATCELIAPCDQDDIWLPYKLEKCVAAIVGEGVDLVACHDKIQNEDGSIRQSRELSLDKNALIWDNAVSGHLMVFNKSVLNVFGVASEAVFDWGLAIYAASTGRGALIDDVECIWRRHSGVVTTAVSAARQEVEDLNKWKKLYKSIFMMNCHVYSNPVATVMKNNALIFDYCGQRLHAAIAMNISRQKPLTLIMACWQHAWLRASLDDFKQLSFHDKVGNWCYQFCYPAIWWYDYHTHYGL